MRLVRTQTISVIRAGDPLYLGLLGWALARLSGLPLVVRVNGNNDKVYEATGRPLMPRLFRTRQVEKKIEQFVLAQADLVAAPNQDNLNFALANGAQAEHATLFRYGNLIGKVHFSSPAERVKGRQLLQELGSLDPKLILYVGRLEQVKLADHVIRAFASLRSRGEKVSLLLVGDGSQRNGLSALAEELGVASQVVFCGNRDQQWLAHVIAAADVALSPHTGRALAEVALGAIPIVAYDVDWQPELIKTGFSGELVPYGDWAAMADAAHCLLSDSTYARKLGEHARSLALEMMDPESLNRHEIQQYEALFVRVSR
ncbi:MAG: glycosyltransferase [Gemmatimonadota bacterium]|nr:glycosyltransferase [Gemmatimonadota bacterium]